MNPSTIDLKLMADDVALGYRRAGFEVWHHEFIYSTPRVVMPGTATQPSRQPILFESDSFFVWVQTLIDIRDTNGVYGFRPTVGFLVKDEESGYFFSDMVLGEIPAQLHSGMPGTPFQLEFPYVFPPGGRATVTLRTLDTGHLATVILSLAGVKLYTRPYSRDVRLPDPW